MTGSFYVFFEKNIENDPAIIILQFSVSWIEFSPMGPIRGNVTGSFYVFFVTWVPTCLTGIDISRN